MEKKPIVEYLNKDDKRLQDYMRDNYDLIGFGCHPFGLNDEGVIKFEYKETDSDIWKYFKSIANEESAWKNIWSRYREEVYSFEDTIQFCRESGFSIADIVNCFLSDYKKIQDKKILTSSIEKIKVTHTIGLIEQELLETVFVAGWNGVGEEFIHVYKMEVKKIVDEKFGKNSWKNMIEMLIKKHTDNLPF